MNEQQFADARLRHVESHRLLNTLAATDSPVHNEAAVLVAERDALRLALEEIATLHPARIKRASQMARNALATGRTGGDGSWTAAGAETEAA